MEIKSRALIQRVDKVSTSSEREDARMVKRGDVIVVVGPNHEFSEVEMNTPQWVVVDSDMTVGEWEIFLKPEAGDSLTQPLLKIRALGLDLDELTKAVDEDEKPNDAYPFKRPFKHKKKDILKHAKEKTGAPIRTLEI